MTGEVRALGAIVMGLTAVLAVAFAVLLVVDYLAPTIKALETIVH